MNILKKSFNKKINGTGLAIFRIAYSTVLLCEIIQLYYFRHLIYDKIPYLIPAEIDFGIPIAIWGISVVALIFGFFTRFFTIINYLLGLILIGTITTYEYHVFYAYMGVNFLLMFMPISQCISLDRLIEKIKYSNTTYRHIPSKMVRQAHYFLPVFFGIALVYFDSIFIKTSAYSWVNGLGMWMPSSFPMMAQFNLSPVLNVKWLMIFLGYLTLLFEAVFLFLFFRKKFRLPLFFIGFGLHIGILIAFPIPWFALTVISIYLLLIPISFWEKIKFKKKTKSTLTFLYDKDCPLCIRTVIVLQHFDWFNKISFETVQYDSQNFKQLASIPEEKLLLDIFSLNTKGSVYNGVDTYIQCFRRIIALFPLFILLKIPGVYHLAYRIYNYVAKNRETERCTEENCGYNPPQINDVNQIKLLKKLKFEDLYYVIFKFFVITVLTVQCLIIFKSPVIIIFRKEVGFHQSIIDNYANYYIGKISRSTKKYLGITGHGVFIDKYHYNGYEHIIAITYQNSDGDEIWLPIIDENGQPDWYNYGTNWRKVSFSMNGPKINQQTLARGVRDFTAFWAEKNGINLKRLGIHKFNIKVKKIDSPNGWEKDYLNRQIAKPWVDGGYVIWEDKEFKSYIKEIEKI